MHLIWNHEGHVGMTEKIKGSLRSFEPSWSAYHSEMRCAPEEQLQSEVITTELFMWMPFLSKATSIFL